MRLLTVTFLALACLVSCSKPGTGGKTTSKLDSAASANFSGYVVVDLGHRTIGLKKAIPDLLSDPAYRTTHIVFKRIRGASATLGAVENESLAVTDEKARYGKRHVDEFLIGVFEITKEQWTTLAASTALTTPWTGLTSVVPDPGAAVGVPAYNLSADAVHQVLDAFGPVAGYSLRMPTGDEWEAACRAGGSTLFTWGDQLSGELPDDQAVFLGATTFARAGSKLANDFGLFDMHGNAWELVEDDDVQLRGGSWLDPIVQTRCANQAPIPYAASHPLAGVRLVLDK